MQHWHTSTTIQRTPLPSPAVPDLNKPGRLRNWLPLIPHTIHTHATTISALHYNVCSNLVRSTYPKSRTWMNFNIQYNDTMFTMSCTKNTKDHRPVM